MPGRRNRKNVKKATAPAQTLNPDSVSSSTRQDYSIEVNIIEAQDIIGKNAGGSADPYVKVKCAGKSARTKTFKHITGSCMFNETMNFDLKDYNILQLHAEKLSISMRDKEGFGQADIVYGKYEFSLGEVYENNANHEYYKQWIGLADAASHGIQARLKVSVTVLSVGDPRPEHFDEDEEEDNETILVDSDVKRRETVLEIGVFKVEDAPIKKKHTSFLLDYAGMAPQTNAAKVNEKGFVLQGLRVPVAEPVMNPHIRISLKEMGLFQGVDAPPTRGIITLNYAAVRNQPVVETWFNLYGAPNGKVNKAAKEMNSAFRVGSTYVGKVLLSAKVLDKKHTEIKDYDKPFTVRRPSPPSSMNYVIQFDLYEGQEAFAAKGRVSVEVSCGSYSKRTKPVDVHAGKFTHYAPLPELECRLSASVDQVPDIFVYLIDAQDNRFAFLRFPFKKVVGKVWKVPPTWHYFQYDESVLEADEFDPAALFSLRAGPSNRKPNRPYLVSRPLAGGQDMYTTGMYSLLGELTEAHDDDDAKGLNASTEEKKGGLIITKPKKAPTVNISKVRKVGKLKLTVGRVENIPLRERVPTVFVRMYIGNNKVKESPKVKSVAGEHAYDPTTGHCRLCGVNSESKQSGKCSKHVSVDLNHTIYFEQISMDQPLVMELWKDNKMLATKKIGHVSVDLLAQSELALQEKMKEDARAKLGDSFTIANWFPLSNESSIEGFSDAVIHATIEFEYFDDEQSERVERTILAKERRLTTLSTRRDTVMYHSSPALGRPSLRNFQLRVHVYLARNLPLGKSANPNPVMNVHCASTTVYTKPCEKTIDPMWFTTVCTNVCMAVPLDLAPDIFVRITDGVGGECLAEFVVPARKAREMNTTINGKLHADWFQLRQDSNQEIPNGMCLCSFQLLTAEEVLKVPIPTSIRPNYESKFLEILTLGIVNLHQGMGVYKPYVEFSLMENNVRRTECTEVSKSENKRNPIFCAINHLEVSIPTDGDMKFAAAVQVDVRDAGLVTGLGQLLGSGSINLQDVKKLQEEMEAAVFVPGEEKIRKYIYEKKKVEREKAAEKKRKAGLDRRARAQVLRQNKRLGKRNKQREEKTPLLDGEIELDELSDDGWPDFETDSDDSAAEDDLPVHLRKNRVVVRDNLEDILNMQPFNSTELYYGSFLSGMSEVGTFKGLFRVVDKVDTKLVKEKLKALRPRKMMLRIYIFEGSNLRARNVGGSCDPYIQIKSGSEVVYKGRDDHLTKDTNPEFYVVVPDIPVEIPGGGEIKISVYDYNTIRDTELGSTIIDVDNRFFSNEWSKLKQKPIESRPLTRGGVAKGVEQGRLSCLIEMYTPDDAGRIPPMVISKPEVVMFELRIVVWSVQNLVVDGDVPEISNPLVKVAIQGAVNSQKETKFQKKTDYHGRAKDGVGVFNYRLKFQLELPPPPHTAWPRVQFAVYEHNGVGNSAALCQKTVPLKQFCRQALKERKERNYYNGGPEQENRNFVENLTSASSNRQCSADVEVSIELLAMDVADKYPNGSGRNKPNVYPVCPEPPGRENVISRGLKNMKDGANKFMWKYIKKMIMAYFWYGVGCLALAIFVYNYIMTDRALF